MDSLKSSKPAILIETSNASIDTMAVTIRSLHVNSKQMTLAVFRQLPVFYVYQDDGTLSDVDRWGLVRYKIRDEGDLWLVASKDGALYRGDAKDYLCFGMDSWVSSSDISYLKQIINQAKKEYNEAVEWEIAVRNYKEESSKYYKQLKEVKQQCPFDEFSDYFNHSKWVSERMPKEPKHIYDSSIRNDKLLKDWSSGISDYYFSYIKDCKLRLKLKETIYSSYHELLKLPQLFIAV